MKTTEQAWRIRSANNGNSLGIYRATSEEAAVELFAQDMAPILIDVYAELLEVA